MNFAEEELHQYRKCPQESIVDIFVHDRERLLALVFAGSRHGDGWAEVCSNTER